jgi:hypothetical protein
MRQNERCDQRRLAVLARDIRMARRTAAAPKTRLVDVPNEVPLPLAKDERPALPDAAGDRQVLDELDYRLSPPSIAISPSNLPLLLRAWQFEGRPRLRIEPEPVAQACQKRRLLVYDLKPCTLRLCPFGVPTTY